MARQGDAILLENAWKMREKGKRKGKKNKVGISKASRTPRIPCSPYHLGDALKTLPLCMFPVGQLVACDLNYLVVCTAELLIHCHFYLLLSISFFHCRSTRETTPCSLISNSETVRTPGSTTKSKTSNSMTSHRTREASLCRFVPTSVEMEEFFAASEQQAQHAFRERYDLLASHYYLSILLVLFHHAP
jgi:hypothetical protein